MKLVKTHSELLTKDQISQSY